MLSMDLEKSFKYLPGDFSQHTSEAKRYFYFHFETGKYDIQINTEVMRKFIDTFKEKKGKIFLAFWNWSLGACFSSTPVLPKVGFSPITIKRSWISLNSRNIILLMQLFFLNETG